MIFKLKHGIIQFIHQMKYQSQEQHTSVSYLKMKKYIYMVEGLTIGEQVICIY
jgi:hypothetical protein